MGHNVSSLKVCAKVSVVGGSGAVDAIRLSYRRTSCCGRRWRQIASFTFPRGGWSSEDVVRSASSNVASVKLGKLRNKDGNTPVNVTCLAGGVSVFRTEITISDLVCFLERTKQENNAVLFFTLVGKVAENNEPEAPAFTAMFCNGERCGDDGAKHPPSRVLPQELVQEHTGADSGSSPGEINELQPQQLMATNEVHLPAVVSSTLSEKFVVQHTWPEVRSSAGGMSWFQPLHLMAENGVSSAGKDVTESEVDADSLEIPALVPSTVSQNLAEEHTATDVRSSAGGISWFQPLKLIKGRPVRRVALFSVLGVFALTALLVVLEPMLPGLDDDEV